jgi:NitT/TauT family transport system permease protein
MNSKTLIQIILLILAFAVLLVWEVAGLYAHAFTKQWGYPSEILNTIADWLISGYIWIHIWSTLSIALVGLGLGLITGIVFAFVLHSIKPLGAVLTPLLVWLNSLPRILLVPIFIASLGIGLTAKLMMVVAMTFFPFFFNVLAGLKAIDQRIIINARLLGANRNQLLRHIYSALLGSWVIAVLRPSLGFALIGSIISEYFGATSGIGYVIDLAYGRDRYDQALAGLLLVFIIAALLDSLTQKLENRWLGESTVSREV